MSSQSGKFITIEGQDGAGKTTNMTFLCDYLRENGQELVITREPGGTELGEALRELLLERSQLEIADLPELLMIFAARAQHLESVIRPALQAGKWVVCDRFTDATYAYQGAGRGLDQSAIAGLETLVQNGLTPDLTVLLDVDTDIGQQRVQKRQEAMDRFERQQMDFKQRVRHYYLTLADQQAERVKRIDAGKTLEQVQQDIAVVLDEFIAQANGAG